MALRNYLKRYIKIRNDGVIEVDNPFGIYNLKIYNIVLLGGKVQIHIKIRDYAREKCPQCCNKYSNWKNYRLGLCMDCGRVNELLR